jgi:Ca-activated chloride channel family protein
VSFLAPERLLLLWGVGALALAYLVLARLRRHYAVRFTNLNLLASLAPRRPGWRRHLPAAATLGALLLLVVGFARPVRAERVPKKGGIIVLAVDVSGSMGASDVAPSRLQAAQGAAGDFVRRLPGAVRLGFVAFDATARVLVAPTTDRAQVIQAIEALELGTGTATGEGVFAALGSIAAAGGKAEGKEDEDPLARIVMMSDGRQTTGRPLSMAWRAAKSAVVPVWTIAFGTDEGTITLQDGQEMRVPADRPAMRALAQETDGKFFEAESAAELSRVYKGIGSAIGYVTEEREYTASFVGLALVLLAAAALGGLWWSARFL